MEPEYCIEGLMKKEKESSPENEEPFVDPMHSLDLTVRNLEIYGRCLSQEYQGMTHNIMGSAMINGAKIIRTLKERLDNL